MPSSKEFLEETIKVWQPYSKKPLSLADAEEMTRNMIQFIELLIEIDRKQDGRKLRRTTQKNT